MEKIRDKIKERIRENRIYKKTLEHKYLALFLLLAIILMTYSYFTQGFIYDVASQNLEQTRDFIKSFGSFSWLIYIIATVLEIIIAPIPSIIITVAGSLTFGPFNAAILTIIGGFLGNIITYFIAKYYGNEYFENLISEKKRALFHKYSEKYGPLVLFILRLNPITSNDIFSYLAGLIGIPFWKFLFSTMLGVIPMIFIVSYFGEAFIKDNPIFKLLFIVITLVYILIFLYFLLRLSKNKVKEKIKNLRK